MLQAPNPTLRDRILAAAQKQHFIKIPFAPANLNFKAFDGFMALGSGASNAVPRLIAIFEADLSPFSQQAVPAILGEIGLAAEPAIPALLRAIAHTNAFVRHNTILALGQIHAQPKLVVPVLIKCLDDPQATVRADAARALGAFGKDAQSAVPALLDLRRKEALSPVSTGPTSGVAYVSGWIVSPTGRMTLPGACIDPNVLASTMGALNQISPAVAAEVDLH